MAIDAERFLAAAAGFTQATKPATSADRPNRLATIDYDYDPTTWPVTLPRVLFEGEQTVTRKRWPVLSGYTPQPGDRVLMVPQGARSYVIVGTLTAPVEVKDRLFWKTADQSVTSSTTLVDDVHLSAPVEANSVYRVILALNATGSTSGDIKLAWGTPSGSDGGGRWLQGPAAGQDPGSPALMEVRAAFWATERSYGLSATAASIIEHGLLQTGSTPGTLQLRWAQNNSNATATTVATRSNLWITRFG